VNGTRIAVGREGTACRTPTATSKKREGVECQEYAIALWVTGAQAEPTLLEERSAWGNRWDLEWLGWRRND
jgi:hypothetical protein